MRNDPWTLGSLSFRSLVAVATALVLLLGLSMSTAPTASAASAPTVFHGSRKGPVAVSAPKIRTVAALKLPAGRYFVTAKAVIMGTGGSLSNIPIAECRLVLGSSVDRIMAAPMWQNQAGSRVPILLTVAGRLGKAGKVRLKCVGAAKPGDARIRDIRITATRVGRLTMSRKGSLEQTIGSGTPRIISSSNPGGVWVPGDAAYHGVGSLDLPAGRWWIIAKATPNSSTEFTTTSRCVLEAGQDHDDLKFPISLSGWGGSYVPLALQVVHRFKTPGTVRLRCKSAFSFGVSNVTITAIKAGRLTNSALPTPLQVAVGPSGGTGNPRIISGWANGPLNIPKGSKFKTIGKLYLPKGRWTVLAKLWFEGDDIPATPVVARTVSCRLAFGKDKDPVLIRFGGQWTRIAPMVLSVVHRSKSAQAVKLQCRRTSAAGTGKAYFIKITALRAGILTKRNL